MTLWLREIEAGLGRRWAWAAVVAVAVGVAAFATNLHGAESPRTYAALIASWLFFAGAAAGALAFRAFFQIVDARWARPLGGLVGLPARFAPVAILLLVVILAGGASAPWLPPGSSGSSWLNLPNLAARELGLAAVLFGFAYLTFRPRPTRPARPSRPMAVVYCLLYAVVLSVWGFDFVLGPDPTFESTLVGPYVFMAAFIAGTGMVTLLGVARGALTEGERRDAGALVLALSIFWAYLFWSQYLTAWYGDLPQEVVFVLRRARSGWGAVVLVVIGLVFAFPFLMLLHPRGRKSSRVLGGVLVVQLVGLWLNCHLMVVPSLAAADTPPLELRDVLVALGMLGAFALSSAGWQPCRAARSNHSRVAGSAG